MDPQADGHPPESRGAADVTAPQFLKTPPEWSVVVKQLTATAVRTAVAAPVRLYLILLYDSMELIRYTNRNLGRYMI